MIAVDTTHQTQSICFKQGDALRGFHGQRSIFSIQDVVADHPGMLKDADVLLANIGPGQLTATRVGLAFVQGLACTLSVPVYGIKQSMLRTAWQYWQFGPGQYRVSFPIDSKHHACAVYEWSDETFKVIQEDTLLPSTDKPDDAFPVESAAMLMCDLYLWLQKRDLVDVLPKELVPIYLRPAVTPKSESC